MAPGEPKRQEGGRRCQPGTDPETETRPLVSIITVVFNGAMTLEKTVRSVADQTFRNFEYIIIDGGSTDGTNDLLIEHTEEIDYWISEADNGIYDALNKGIDLARGDWLYFIGADDRLVDNSILERFFSRPVDSKMLYGNVYWGENGETVAGEFYPERVYTRNICQQAIFYHRKLFQRLGNFDLKYRLVADWVFNMQAFGLKTTRPQYMDCVVAVYSLGGASTNVWDKEFLKNREKLFIRSFGIGTYFRFKGASLFEKALRHSPKLKAIVDYCSRQGND